MKNFFLYNKYYEQFFKDHEIKKNFKLIKIIISTLF